MPADFESKNVIITGAAGGLGGAVVEAFLSAGARCHVPVREATAITPRAGLTITPGIDLTDERAVRSYYDSLPAVWASVHVAGGFAAAPFLETSLADLRRQVDLNLVTAFLACREAARRMRGTGGRLVNVTARAALAPPSGMVAYVASKAALAALTQALAKELEPENILVNAVAPSIIDTPANRAAMPDADASRWPKPAEIAAAILWLASPQNRLTSGAVVPVYGHA